MNPIQSQLPATFSHDAMKTYIAIVLKAEASGEQRSLGKICIAFWPFLVTKLGAFGFFCFF